MKNAFFKLIKHPWLLLLLAAVGYVLLLTVPYISHKAVSESQKSQIETRTYYGDSTGTERAGYIDDNTEALLYRLHLMEQAEHEIILSTFDFDVDEASKDIMASLLAAADRGVTVRILVDGFSGFLDVSPSPWFQALASHERVTLKIYNPIRPLLPWKMQARLHDKYLIVDDKMFLLGGRNTFNLFLGDYSAKKNIDRELFIYEKEQNPESALFQLRSYFESIWASKDSKTFTGHRSKKKVNACLAWLKEHPAKLRTMYPEAYQPWDYEALTVPTSRVTLLSNPISSGNKEPWMWYTLHHLMQSGKHVTIYTPYIICGKEMYADLTSLCQPPRQVEIITNDVASGANPWGCTDYLNEKEKIWATGARVYEYLGEHSSHTKAVLIDDRMSIVGSYNLDMRSAYQDTELMLAVDSPELNAIIRKEAERDKTFSRYMTEEGTYQNGENYVPQEISAGKKIFYQIFRILVKPLRRFL